MSIRPVSREQVWLLPPSLSELIGACHPARFVAAFVDSLGRLDWLALGIEPQGQALGAPAYDPRALLCVWLYGFMVGIRSSRKLEAACRDQLAFLWLTGWQQPDHNTLWRFYQAHRVEMRKLFKRTVQTAVKLGLVDLAVQALDGTKVAGNAAKDRTHDGAELTKILERVEAAIADLEAQNATGGDPPPPALPQRLAQAQDLRDQVKAALAQVTAEEGPKRVNLTDGEAGLMKVRGGYVAGYNAQAMVSPLAEEAARGTGLFITAEAVTTDPDDHSSLLPMLAEAEANTGQRAKETSADTGYFSGENLKALAERGQVVLMPDEERARNNPYHKDAFRHDPTTDTYTCPEGQTLRLSGTETHPDGAQTRKYRAGTAVCRACPAYGECTTDKRGRKIEVGPYEPYLRAQRALMATEEAQAAYRGRRELPEPAFGILKEQQNARRFLLRGLEAVRAEWSLLATAFNLRSLCRVWQRGGLPTAAWALAWASR